MCEHSRKLFMEYTLMSDKPLVIVDPNFRRMDEIFSSADRARLYEMVDVVWGKDDLMPQAAFMAALPDAQAIICCDWRYGDVLAHAPKLRAIFDVTGAFPSTLDYDYCHTHKIRVLCSIPSFTRQVAEMSLGMAIAAAREIPLGDRLFREGNEQYLHAGNVGTFLMYGKRVGIIGYGGIARSLKPLLEPFGVSIKAYDPWLSPGYLRSLGVQPASLNEVLSESEYIFVLAVPTAENRALLGRDELALIQPNAVFVLMSRAHVVDFDALTECALADRFRVVTDVFPAEPLAKDHPIRKAERAIFSAHRAGSVVEGLQEMGEMVVDDLWSVLRGLPPVRLQSAQPELIRRYAPITVPADE
jgi:phosphoglycerate dehydrogenase-like enzyme